MNAFKLRIRLAQAIATHQAGQYVEAEAAYRKLLKASPDNGQVHCMLGILACETGRPDLGIASLERAIQLEPREAVAYFNLGNALTQVGRAADAVRCYERLLRLTPADAEVHVQLGQALMQCAAPERAIEHYRHAVRLRPNVADWHDFLGVALKTTGDHAGAIAAYREAVRLAPRGGRVHYHLGIALRAAGKTDEALAAFETAARIEPRDADVQNNLGNLLRLSGKIEQAITVLERALTLDANHPGIRVNLANALMDHNRAQDSLQHYEYAAAAYSHDAEYHVCYGVALEAVGRHDDAMAECRIALRLHPGNPDAQFLLGLRALAMRDYAEGWKGYEYRWSGRKVALRLRQFSQPRWNGESLRGKRLLIHAEQGIGDEIMFASIFAEILAEANHCTIECAPKLESLFRRSFPTASVVTVPRTPDWFDSSPRALLDGGEPDYQIPAGSLPSLRRRTTADFPRHEGYLRADEEKIAYWRSQLAALGSGLKVGLSWRGGTVRTTTRRSLSALQLLPILAVPGSHFVSLQYTPCADELDELSERTGLQIHHWQSAIDDYGETAALVCALDLTISVCTSVIHLGGALGKPMWVMAPRYPEWRYGLAGEDMPWYPTVRIFRQEASAQWQPVIERVAEELRRIAIV